MRVLSGVLRIPPLTGHGYPLNLDAETKALLIVKDTLIYFAVIGPR